MRAISYRFLHSLNLTSKNVVYVEGGLGSQLYGVMLGIARRECEPTVRIDTSYFLDEPKHPTPDGSGLVRWPWELHRYGISATDFDMKRHRFSIRLSARHQMELESEYLPRLTDRSWSDVFPIVPEAVNELRQLGLTERIGEFGCVHMRRGDYLSVSARVVGLMEVIGICERVRPILPPTLLFFTDSSFTWEEKGLIHSNLSENNCVFLETNDQHSVHGIMRLASFLVTSNSTFSYTAALLNQIPGLITLSPTHFFGPLNQHVNSMFQANSDWMLLKSKEVLGSTLGN